MGSNTGEKDMEQTILTDDQYADLSKKIIHALERKYKIVPLNSLRHPRYFLRSPVYVALEFTDDQVIASLDDIEAFCCANTEFEATSQLCEEIVQIYEDLMEDQATLAPLPRKWLAYLKETIGCK
ncbi:MAG: hypothetical protein QG552_3787 [Thermodesulfobacteriota bacterium]|nr:hypothetical protein [Thermodesulfobacteriota bacterium]